MDFQRKRNTLLFMKGMKGKLIALILSMIFTIGSLYAQQITVTGVVNDSKGEPLVGATVIVKGDIASGVSTNIDGRFTIKAEKKDILQISFIGMRTKEITVAGAGPLEITLEDDFVGIDDVMVVAYGVSKKSTFTGSASVVNTEKLESRTVTDFTKALVSNTTGVQVMGSGQPGTDSYVRIRGLGSMNASNSPLYVIDGVAVSMTDLSQLSNTTTNPMASINPNDIESMTVLKDAAAASLYGSRAANGVIIITTKKGKEGKPKFNFDYRIGVSDLLYNADVIKSKDEFADCWVKAEMHYQMWRDNSKNYSAISDIYNDPEQYNEYLQDARGAFNSYHPVEGVVYDFWGDGYDKFTETDWQEEIMRSGNRTEHVNLSASGGKNGTTYFASCEYSNTDYAVLNTGLKRYSGRVNISSKSNDKIWFGANMNYSHVDQSGPQNTNMFANPVRAANQLDPLNPVYNSDGSYNTSFSGSALSGYNPVQIMNKSDFETLSYRELLTAWAQYNIVKGLFLKTTFGADIRNTDETRWYPPGVGKGKSADGILDKNKSVRRRLTTSNVLNYNTTFAKLHNINFLVGFEAEKTKTELWSSSASGFETEFTSVLSAASTIESLSGYNYADALVSVLSNFEYNYNDKYYLQASFRRDGSSRFPQDRRYGNFWSVSGSWRLKSETFFQDITWLDDAKLRVSYGTNGNLPSTVFSYIGNYVFGYDYNGESGAVVRNVENTSLTWEKNENFNIGTDLRLFNRISTSIEYYSRISDGLLLDKEISMITGYTDATVNDGAMRNRGVEFDINALIVKRNDFSWEASFNTTYLKNKVTSMPDDDISSYTIIREGEAYASFYLPEWAGIDKTTGEGQWYVYDESTGEKTITKDSDEATYVVSGNRFPLFSGGFGSTLNYKNFSFDFLFGYGLGFKVMDYDGARYLQDNGYYQYYTKERAILDSWSPDNTSSDKPLLIRGTRNGSQYSTRHIHDGDYLKLRSVKLSYSVPEKLTRMIGGNTKVTVYAQGENLFITCKMPNFDPEVSTVSKRYLYNMPTQRTVSAGINVKF